MPSRRARPALTVIVVSEWPSRSCRSRAIRTRSFSAASRASSALASARASLARSDWSTANVMIATTGMATGVTSMNDLPRLTCQDGIRTGTTRALTVKTATIGTHQRPRRATARMVR